jgi:hypothetical protein
MCGTSAMAFCTQPAMCLPIASLWSCPVLIDAALAARSTLSGDGESSAIESIVVCCVVVLLVGIDLVVVGGL